MQAAKGSPGKRMSKGDRALAEAQRLAALVAALPAESSDPFSPPAILLDERLAPALVVWRELAAELKKFNIVSALDRYTFAVFCITVADYMAAVDNVLVNGPCHSVKTIAGDKMMRTNPAVKIKERLGRFIFDAAAEFGLSPLRRYALLREQSAYGGGAIAPAASASHDAQAPHSSDHDDLIGLAARRNSPAPTLQ
jgi:P27 family predicted phage terminase small subunit